MIGTGTSLESVAVVIVKRTLDLGLAFVITWSVAALLAVAKTAFVAAIVATEAFIAAILKAFVVHWLNALSIVVPSPLALSSFCSRRKTSLDLYTFSRYSFIFQNNFLL